MKKCIIFLILIFICSCAHQPAVKEEEPLTPPLLSGIPTQTMDKSALPSKEPIKPLYGKLLSKVSASKSSFNPSHGEEAAISYYLSKPAKVTINLYDPDWVLIKTIGAEEYIASGEQTSIWDGKDMNGNVVPDEAYFFTIIAEDEAGAKEVYDPTAFSGGIGHDITTADINPEIGTITYKMPEMGRVLIRIGIQGGSLLNALVDWKPRVKGAITDYWNGKDEDNLVDLYNHPKFKMIVTYFTLPENSVITFGNKSLTYREYKKSITAKRPVKIERASSISNLSPHYRLSRTIDYSPHVKMDFMNTQGTASDGAVILKDKTLIKVELDEEDKVIFQNQQFEICFFLDHEFYAEDESGYTPFNWVWDLSNVEEGEHILTVNLSSFKDQIGIKSQKVRVVK